MKKETIKNLAIKKLAQNYGGHTNLEAKSYQYGFCDGYDQKVKLIEAQKYIGEITEYKKGFNDAIDKVLNMINNGL
jgi:hypothetical protein